jgi:hypothetical protein
MTKPIAIEDFDLNDERVAFIEAKPGGWAGTVSVAAFTKALDDAGVPEEKQPSAPSANKCLQRAMDALNTFLADGSYWFYCGNAASDFPRPTTIRLLR